MLMRYVKFVVVTICVLLPLTASAGDPSGVIPNLQPNLQMESACLEITPPISVAVSPASDPAVQSGLWMAHLTQYLDTHPQLTDDQRSVVMAGRELVANGLLHQLRSPNAAVATNAHAMLAAFEARAWEHFSKEAYAEAFIRVKRPAASRSLVPGDAKPMAPECDCNWYTGECGDSCPTGNCIAMPTGCGTMGGVGCFGLCG
jgi:hypothetical protein